MNFPGRWGWGGLCLMLVLFIVVPIAGAKEKAKKVKQDTLDLIDVRGCEGVKLTQCELAKGLIATLKMGEDVTCEAGFVHLRALEIAPGADWSYEDPHKMVTLEEIKDVIMDVHQAYNDGNVRLDGFAVAEEINRLCLDMKGPSPVAPSEGGKEEVKPPLPAPQEQE